MWAVTLYLCNTIYQCTHCKGEESDNLTKGLVFSSTTHYPDIRELPNSVKLYDSQPGPQESILNEEVLEVRRSYNIFI
jgi:hypothetical protein